MVVPEFGGDAWSGQVAGGDMIEIEFAAGARMRIVGAVDAATLKTMVAAPADGRCAGVGCDQPHRHARGMNSLAFLMQAAFKRDTHGGDLYVFRGKSGKLISILWHDGLGISLYAKRPEHGRFLWPSPADGAGEDHAGPVWPGGYRNALGYCRRPVDRWDLNR